MYGVERGKSWRCKCWFIISKAYLSLFIPKYLKGKNDAASITYDCSQLEPILNPTYGCIVYQEQVMQIVRDLGGYTLGRSDLLRRAMSKKKAAVMEKERKNFVYGNPEENVPGCIQNGIDEKTANKIYDEMIDFAKYAFNKSHAAAYAVVSYQTAYLKYYYPLEFMAALMTSVIDNASKVCEYIYSCRNMNITILPPHVNESEGTFSVSGNSIRYGLNAVKSVGKSVVENIVKERKQNGLYISLENFIDRLSGIEITKRIVENLIKAGAFDNMGGTRKQLGSVYASIMDQVNTQKKKSIEGQMSLFDLVSEESKKEYEIQLPDIGEYSKELLLQFEKEVLGFYISGHPLEEYEEKWRKNITAMTKDFVLDEELEETVVKDGENVWIGGIITAKTTKSTRNNRIMAFLTIEDLVGTVEVVLFPPNYEKNHAQIVVDNRVFVKGRASVNEDGNGKVICEKIVQFDDVPQELWIKFENREEYEKKVKKLEKMIENAEGKSPVILYLAEEKAKKMLTNNKNVMITHTLLENLYKEFSEKNIKVVEKSIENIPKML